MKMQLQKEFDLRVASENQLEQIGKQLKIARQENKNREIEVQAYRKDLENAKAEARLLSLLLRGDDDLDDDEEEDGSPIKDNYDEGSDEERKDPKKEAKKKSKEELKLERQERHLLELEEKIKDDAEGAARHYGNLVEIAQEEYQVLN